MVDENITPEERLLKLIENPKEIEKHNISLSPAGQSTVKAAVLKAPFDFKHLDIKAIAKKLDLHFASKAVLGLCVVFTLFCIFDFVKTQARLNKNFNNILSGSETKDISKTVDNLPEPNIKDVAAQALKRNIFTFTPAPITAQAQGVANLAQASADYKLVGIMWSDNPQAMLEDVKMQKTYLLNANEKIGDFTLKKIYRDRVVIAKDEQELELR